VRAATPTQSRKVGQTWSFRGSKSRNKVSVGEPAEGSLLSKGLLAQPPKPLYTTKLFMLLRWTFNVYRSPTKTHKMMVSDLKKMVKTFNNGSLGSRIDEERSEMR
jgi:hypothetical protein